VQQDRAALGQLGSGIEGIGLHVHVAADDVLRFHERALDDDLLWFDDASFRLQCGAGVENPAPLQPLCNPGLPLLVKSPQFFGRHRVEGVFVAAVDK
jgi:hypothetical protein